MEQSDIKATLLNISHVLQQAAIYEHASHDKRADLIQHAQDALYLLNYRYRNFLREQAEQLKAAAVSARINNHQSE